MWTRRRRWGDPTGDTSKPTAWAASEVVATPAMN